jgi:hypothetical protein
VATSGGKTTYNATFFAYTGLKTGMVTYGKSFAMMYNVHS